MRTRGEWADDAELERLLDSGKTVVLITQGIHATEVGSSQMSANLAYELAASEDAAVRQILEDVILLQIPSLNPDGLQWVVDWYNDLVGTDFEGAPLPWLYHFYTGHDNNRDWYAFTQQETILTVQGAHNAWHPQIVHDVHQMGAYGARIFVPPYIEPWEPNIDPALVTAVTQLGTYMAAELTAQGKEGVVFNGDLRRLHACARVHALSRRRAHSLGDGLGESGRAHDRVAESPWSRPQL